MIIKASETAWPFRHQQRPAELLRCPRRRPIIRRSAAQRPFLRRLQSTVCCTALVRALFCRVFDNSTRVLAFDPIGSVFLSDPMLTKSIYTFWRRLCRREHIFGCAVREFRPADNNGDGGGCRSADDSGEHRVARRCAVLQLPTGGHQQHRYVLMPHRLRMPLILQTQMEQTTRLSSSISELCGFETVQNYGLCDLKWPDETHVNRACGGRVRDYSGLRPLPVRVLAHRVGAPLHQRFPGRGA